MTWIEALVLGVVQGLTEFLPVSSDGHLNITQYLFEWLSGESRSGRENLFFIVVLHFGTLAAIVLFYRKVAARALRPLFRRQTETEQGLDRRLVWKVLLLAAIATSPLIPFALLLKDFVEGTFQDGRAAGLGFLITAGVLLFVSARLRGPEGTKGPAETTWLDALLIGLAQMLAPFPGVSRSGMTIAAGLLLGLSRTWAVGFSLLIAVPAISGGLLFEFKHLLDDPVSLRLTPERIAQTVAATVLAGGVGYVAILWLVRVVRAGHLWYFSVYLLGLGLVVLWLASTSRIPADDRSPNALDRTAGSTDSGSTSQARGGPGALPVVVVHGPWSE
jgi:undecaprenyl-diphosphatase